MELIVIPQAELKEILREIVVEAIEQMNQSQEPQKLNRKSAAEYLQVSVNTVDNIARTHPDIVCKRYDDRNKPYFLQHELDNYKKYQGTA